MQILSQIKEVSHRASIFSLKKTTENGKTRRWEKGGECAKLKAGAAEIIHALQTCHHILSAAGLGPSECFRPTDSD